MKIALCDDCREDALYLKNFLGKQDVSIYSDAGSLLSDIEQNNIQYDLYLLDIYMDDFAENPMDGIELLLHKVSKRMEKSREHKFFYRWRGQTRAIPYEKILFISSREHKVFIQCKDGAEQEFKGKLDEIAAQLKGNIFLRCHQSFLVNVYQVDSLSRNEIMVFGHRVPVSRRYYVDVKKRYQEVLFEEVGG